jgi:hypothetical protein
MSVTSVSNTTAANPPSAPDSSFRTAMQQLTSAISSGDLQSAQSAYATLTNLQQGSGASNANSPMGQFLSSIGADLSKGDITTAQSDLTTFQKAHAGHHHKPPAGSTSAGAASPPDTASADTATSQTSSSNILDISA